MSDQGKNQGRKSFLGSVSSFLGFGASPSVVKAPSIAPPKPLTSAPKKVRDDWAGSNPTSSQIRQAQHQRYMLGKGDHPDVIEKRKINTAPKPPVSLDPSSPPPSSGIDYSFPGIGYDLGNASVRFGSAHIKAKLDSSGGHLSAGINLKETTYTTPSGSSIGVGMGVGAGVGIEPDGVDNTKFSGSVGRLSASHSFSNKTLESFSRALQKSSAPDGFVDLTE